MVFDLFKKIWGANGEPALKDGLEAPNNRFFRVKRISENGKHLTRELRGIWIDEAAKGKESFKIQCVFGELRGIDVIEKGMRADNCKSVEVVFGPKVLDSDIRSKLETLLKEKNGDKLKLLSLEERPVYHALRISNNYLLEDRHTVFKPYEWATVIPHAGEDIKMAFNNYFNELEKNYNKQYTVNNINELPTYR